MNDFSEKLLEQAINSILHGSIRTVSSQDANGNTVYHEVEINDLRVDLVEKLASKLAATPEFKELIVKVFTSEIIKKMQESLLANVNFSDLPWDVKRKFEEESKNLKLEVKKYKLVAEVIE